MKLEITLQPKQKEAFFKSFETPVMFYGGAKGGGKSYLARAREIYRRLKYPGSKGLIVRKTYPELLSNHIRMFFTEYPITTQWFKAGEKAIVYPNDSITEFSYLKSTNDVYTYQGREYEDITVDEITQHEEEVLKILRSSNRTTNPKIKPTILLTGNPGGIGHAWVKRLFVDRIFRDSERPEDFDFVQAKVYDNRALLDADPDYIKRLQDLPSDLRRAYLEGDWDIFAGQVFSEFSREKHIMNPYVPAASYPHFLWIDWGYSGKDSHEGAFAATASALIDENYRGVKFNRVITYKEWYGKFKTPDEWADTLYLDVPVAKYNYGVADSSMFNPQSDGSTPIAEIMQRRWDKHYKSKWITLRPGTKNRVARVATVHNWLSLAPDGLPYWLITDTCKHLIRTLPMLVYDEHNVEDVDTEGEDHLYDAIGYGLSQVRFIPAKLGGIGTTRTERRKLIPIDIASRLNLDSFANTKKSKRRDWRAL